VSGTRVGPKKAVEHTGEVTDEMIMPKIDTLENFRTVQHTFTKEKFYIHKDDEAVVGTGGKLMTYVSKFGQYFAPCALYPKGHYTAKTRVFIGTFLEKAA